jgi:hypothetical protein
MADILLSHPLAILYAVYVAGLVLVAFWPDTPPHRRRAPRPWGAHGAPGRPCLGLRLSRRPTMLRKPRKGKPL